MNYGMYIAASGVAASMARQDVLSNNLANVSTVAFKPDMLDIRARDVARVEHHLGGVPSNLLLERLGGGVMPMATRTSVAQSPLQESGRPLDVALEGPGYFVTRSPRVKSTGPDAIRLTRDGRMAIRADGELVNVASGAPYLDTENHVIHVDPANQNELKIDLSGVIRQGSSEVAQLRLASVPDPTRLIKDGEGQLTPVAGAGSLVAADPDVHQGSIELSGVDPVRAMMDITGASQAAQNGLSMISMFGEMMSRAISALGRVS